MKNNKFSLVVVLLVFLAGFPQAKVLDRIIATVNGNAIFYSEFTARLKPFLEQLNASVADEAERKKQIKQLRKDVLDSLIEEKVLLDKAKDEKIEVTVAEIDKGIADIRSRFETEQEYLDELKKQNLTQEKMRERVKEQLMTVKLINREVRSKVKEPTEKELRDFYKNNEDKMVVGEQVRVKQIFFEVSDKSKKAQILKKARRVLARLRKNPGDFEKLVKEYSDAPENDGDTGYFGRGEKIPEFEDPCFKLRVGEISDVFETPLGFHIVKCIGKKAPEKKTFKEAKDYIRNYLMNSTMEEMYFRWVRNLRDQASIKILDKEFE
ncbi:MAG: peptidylprolyl isomerase [Elusimicrobia bacterium]|nr:peptidylprolyl isomerase [Elusimicrobiota bacterium]